MERFCFATFPAGNIFVSVLCRKIKLLQPLSQTDYHRSPYSKEQIAAYWQSEPLRKYTRR